MQFLLMCCIDESRWGAVAEDQRAEIMRAYGRWVDDHVASGHYVTGGSLHGSATAHTVSRRDGKLVVSDGPFAETKEQIGGYHLIECADLDEALAIAARVPTLPAGGMIEVRPMAAQLGGSVDARTYATSS